MRYLVTYEIPTRHPEYPPLITALRALRATRVLAATWVLESERSAAEVCRHLIVAGCLNMNERILVVALAAEADASWRKLAVGDDAVPVLLGRSG
jgi:hypothetical protein